MSEKKEITLEPGCEIEAADNPLNDMK